MQMCACEARVTAPESGPATDGEGIKLKIKQHPASAPLSSSIHSVDGCCFCCAKEFQLLDRSHCQLLQLTSWLEGAFCKYHLSRRM
ncbi:hypothetical protein AVEN_131228-1 [Araneus ventricosus]|uniref:Uncharacterized protein n=1 Tax=Araneus ventricosus TaxID=182803 RepID=A0A4Y2IRW4_ARAVE|nr:hypothetical protein AVEN_131228-1 [Araneus ventricosus]